MPADLSSDASAVALAVVCDGVGVAGVADRASSVVDVLGASPEGASERMPRKKKGTAPTTQAAFS